MSSINNSWIGYLDRSYLSIKNNLLSKVTTSNPELTDHSESNIFVIIVSMFSGIAEMLNYYIDNMAREGFLSTAQKKQSVVRHSRLLDYRIRAQSPESVNVTFKFLLAGVPTILPSPVTIPSGAVITSTPGGYVFVVPTTVVVPAGVSERIVPMVQQLTVSNITLGNTNGTKNQQFLLPTNYVHNSISLSVAGVPYERVETWAVSNYTTPYYIVEVLENDSVVVELGDGIRGILPTTSQSVVATFKTTDGPPARVGIGQLVTTPTLTLPGSFTAQVNNTGPSSGGEFIEDTESIRINSIYHRRDNDRMVTKGDYQRLTAAVPGVAASGLKFCCANEIEIYIAPEGGGLASQILLDAVADEVNLKKLIGRQTIVLSAGETFIYVEVTAFVKKGRDLIQTQTEVENQILDYGSVENQTINSPIRISDITTGIGNLINVDAIEVDLIYLKPYASPLGHTTVLVWDPVINSGSTTVDSWTISFNSGNFSIIKNRIFMGLVAEDVEYSDGIITFTIDSGGTYTTGEVWHFKTYPRNSSVLLDDFSIPRTKIGDILVNVQYEAEIQIC